MKKTILSALIAMTALNASAQKQVITDPNAQQRNVGAFHAIKVSNAIDILIVPGTEDGLAVSAKTDEFRDKIKTEVKNGVLVISYDESSWKGGGNRKLKAYVSARSLDRITASGACDITVSGKLESKELVLDLSGASDFKGAVETEFFDVKISGASDVFVSGRATAAKVDASGASDFKGFDLETEKCVVEASGASDIKITVNKELTAEASGASGVHYRGSGMIKDVKTSGASSISRKG